MAQRRPISSHPAFAPLLALWFAALLGLGVAVLPAALLARIVAGAGLTAAVPPTTGGRLAISVAAALAGALLGWLLAAPLARRGMRDPRPIYAEPEPPIVELVPGESARRPLLARHDLPDEAPYQASGGMSDEEGWARNDGAEDALPTAPPEEPIHGFESEEGFMILSPQPVHPPRPLDVTGPDLDALLDQFDNALAAFRSDADEGSPTPARGAEAGSDPVHAFVARQTGTPVPSPLGGRMPDHQAELRAALDKLARTHRED